jgi:hypothetical protein
VARRAATGEIDHPEHGRMQGIDTRGDVLVDAVHQGDHVRARVQVAGLHRARLDELIEPRGLRHHGVADLGSSSL